MTKRDDLVNEVKTEIAKTGLNDSAEKIFKTMMLTGVLKLLLTGRSKYDIVRYLNVQSNRCGDDLLPIVREVYDLVKDVEL